MPKTHKEILAEHSKKHQSHEYELGDHDERITAIEKEQEEKKKEKDSLQKKTIWTLGGIIGAGLLWFGDKIAKNLGF